MPSSSRPPVELTVDQRALVEVARVLRTQADGKELRKGLVKGLRASAEPAIREAKASILAAPSQGRTVGAPIRQEIAKRIKPVVRTSGSRTGVSIRVGKTSNVRGFNQAARQFNKPQFRHRVYGGDRWVVQRGKPGWFDDPMQARKPEFRDDVVAVVQRMADELAIRAQAAARRS